MEEVKEIIIDDNHALFDTTGLFYKEFPSDFRQIRYFTLLIVQKAPRSIQEINLLEQQISELIKNAVKHGNNNDVGKMIHVWYSFTDDRARIIVEDEGPGFKAVNKWNEFNRKRIECFQNEDFEQLGNYVSYRTEKSDPQDGGNALFAAVEYWNEGVVFTDKGNKVAVGKTFPKKRLGMEL